MATQAAPSQIALPQINTREDSVIRFLGLPTSVRASHQTTNGAFGLIESWTMPPGFATPYHLHHNEDEAFYVIEGELAVICGGKWMKAGPGSYAFGPREIAHGFKVIGSQPARMLLLCSPGGFERFVLELSQPIDAPPTPPDMAKLMQVAAKFKIDILGPLPEGGNF
jgi:quercetin dioxygenase-like cupin family protein